jgi:hypothetical protein
VLVSGPNRAAGWKGRYYTLSVRLGFALALLAIALLPMALRAADPAAAAHVATLTGQVSVWRNGELWALFPGKNVFVGETIITGRDGYARLEISDGSSFEIYPDSHVVFRSNPGNLRDLVEVLLGKIKVHIQTMGGRPNPYKIHSPTAVISVRGTTFEVAVEADNVTLVAVDEGVVDVAHRLVPGKSVQVTAGQVLHVFPNSPLASAGVDKGAVIQRVANAAREALYVLRTVGRPGGARGPASTPGPGPTPGPPVPVDSQAPPPPPPPPPPPGQ